MNRFEFREMRESLGLTRPELARKVGVAWETVKCWENGRRGIPLYAVKAMHRLRRRKLKTQQETVKAE